MGADAVTAGMVHIGHHGLADTCLAGFDAAQMHEQAAEFFLCVRHPDYQAAGAGDGAGIPNLAAAFGIERRLVQHHGHIRAGCGRLY